VICYRIKIHLKILRATWDTFGFGTALLTRLMLAPVAGFGVMLLFLLDNVFFPGWRRVKVEKPIFIIGHPRSGTTFLHRLFAQTGEFAVFELWELMMPSILGRRLLRPIVRRRVRAGKGVIYPREVGHELSLDSVEEEELLFSFTGNTQFVTINSPLAFSDWDYAELVYCEEQPKRLRRQTMRFFRHCLQRHIYDTGKTQVVAKPNYSGMRIPSLLEEFPDAKIVYVVRSPCETIPSHLSLHRKMLDYQWGLKNIPEDRLTRYFVRRYRYNVAFYRYVEDLIESKTVDSSQLMVLSYAKLREDLDEAVDQVIEFTGLQLSDELRGRIREQCDAQKSYRREHHNLEPEAFGISKKKIAEDLGFVFEKYGFSK
jgi:hypothetical protein